jgi:hypothetical protein
MKTLFGSALLASLVGAAHADDSGMCRYAVSATNITRGQPIAPAAVAAHNGDFNLFVLGSPGIPELAPWRRMETERRC